VVDGSLDAVLADQNGVVRGSDWLFAAQYGVDGVLGRLVRRFVDDAEDFGGESACSFALAPACQGLGHAVEVRDTALRVRDQYRVTDAEEGRFEEIANIGSEAAFRVEGGDELFAASGRRANVGGGHHEEYEKDNTAGDGDQMRPIGIGANQHRPSFDAVPDFCTDLARRLADGFHERGASAGIHQVHAGGFLITAPQNDGIAKFDQFFGDQAAQMGDLGVQSVVVRTFAFQLVEGGGNGFDGASIRVEILLLACEQEASLARFGVRDREEQAAGVLEDLAGGKDVVAILPVRYPVEAGKDRDRHQHEQCNGDRNQFATSEQKLIHRIRGRNVKAGPAMISECFDIIKLAKPNSRSQGRSPPR
jgi:hypothetical protein